ncbi:MAG: hypothetical protein R3C28_33010 [Pirellulaceae bacterium]
MSYISVEKLAAANRCCGDTANYLSDHGLDATTEAVDDSPKRLLAYAAEWDADLIVMETATETC